jgi:hypothetical protein
MCIEYKTQIGAQGQDASEDWVMDSSKLEEEERGDEQKKQSSDSLPLGCRSQLERQFSKRGVPFESFFLYLLLLPLQLLQFVTPGCLSIGARRSDRSVDYSKFLSVLFQSSLTLTFPAAPYLFFIPCVDNCVDHPNFANQSSPTDGHYVIIC